MLFLAVIKQQLAKHRSAWRLRTGLKAVAVLMAIGTIPATAYAIGKPSFFDSTEVRSTNLKPFTKWATAIARYRGEVAQAKKETCGAKTLNKCNYDKWMQFLDGLKGKDRVTQIRAVNDYMNRAPYITDPVNWGVKDYWESPGQFMARFGDCEDYAIAKYLSLKLLGYNEKDMRIVVVKDLNLKIGHAVLVIFYKGNPYILDNQIKQVVPAATIKHYLPVYSINAYSWWRHIPMT